MLYNIGDRILKLFKSSDENYLHQLDSVNSFNVWLPHYKYVLKQIVASNEMWILHDKIGCIRSWVNWKEVQLTVLITKFSSKKVRLLT